MSVCLACGLEVLPITKLIAKMHAKGLLTTEGIIELLDEQFKVATE